MGLLIYIILNQFTEKKKKKKIPLIDGYFSKMFVFLEINISFNALLLEMDTIVMLRLLHQIQS